MSAPGPRVVIVEDHPVMQIGMDAVLRQRGAVVVGSAETAADGYRTVLGLRPDVAVIDLLLPDESGTSLTRRLLQAAPTLRVLLYTAVEEPKQLREALASGARGVALKTSAFARLGDAAMAVASGHEWADPRIKSLAKNGKPEKRGVLSRREREVLALVARGHTADEIGLELQVSPATVRTHVRNAKRRLGARTRTQAVTVALRDGEIEA